MLARRGSNHYSLKKRKDNTKTTGDTMNKEDAPGCADTSLPGLVKTCCAVVLLFLLVACGTTKPTSIDSQLTRQAGYEQTQKDLRIYIRPLQDTHEVKKCFGANLIEKRILPIFVLAENKNDATCF